MRCDCHNDTALSLREYPTLWKLPTKHLDLSRAQKVLDLLFCAIFIKESLYAGRETEEFRHMQQLLASDIATMPEVELLLWREQLESTDKLLILNSMEGAAPLGKAAEHLDEFYAAGLRAIGLTWNFNTDYAGSCFGSGGLTADGIDLVQACNERGILLDAAHSSSETLADLLRYSKQPIIDSHTVCASLCSAYPRGVTDAELKAIAEHGGVACICFVPDFLGGNGDIDRVCEHIEHAVKLIGSEHVGLGGDLDGCIPHAELADVLSYSQLYQRLSQRGMSDSDVANVCGDSVLRLLKEVLPLRQ